MDKAKGIITDAQYLNYRDSFLKDIQAYQEHITDLEEKIRIMEQDMQEKRTKTEILQEYRNIQKLDRPTVEKLIDYIEVGRLEHKEHRNDLPPIIIHWKF